MNKKDTIITLIISVVYFSVFFWFGYSNAQEKQIILTEKDKILILEKELLTCRKTNELCDDTINNLNSFIVMLEYTIQSLADELKHYKKGIIDGQQKQKEKEEL